MAEERPDRIISALAGVINPLIPTLKPQSNGPLYSNTVIGTLAVDNIWYSEEGPTHQRPVYQLYII